MLEGDDDARLREAKANRQFDPNTYYKLKKEVETKKKKEELKKEHQETRKELEAKQKALKEQLGKQGVQNADQKQSFEDIKKQEDIKKAAEDAAGPEQVSSQV